MREFSAPQELFHYVSELKSLNKSIGFVPTMGALHEGHLSLIDQARQENDIVIVSIFVNPLQFNNEGDLTAYPRTISSDIEKLKANNTDALFTPSIEKMYPSKPTVSIHFGELASVLEGEFRKDHFEGVGVVVGKLLHITNPDRAYFGLKDLQQFLLIRKMCDDLSFPTKIIGVETVRSKNGLALSSRNLRLSTKGLETASNIHKGLKMAQEKILKGDHVQEIKNKVIEFYNDTDGLDIEYFEVVDTTNLKSVDTYQELDELAICVAGYVDGIRLIDNLYLRLK